MKYIYLLIIMVICFSCKKENQITNEKEELNIQERELSAGEADFMSINFASSSESSANFGNKMMSYTDGRIYGDLPDEIIGLRIEIYSRRGRILKRADFIRDSKEETDLVNNNKFRQKVNGESSPLICISDGKIRIDTEILIPYEKEVKIFGFQNHILDRSLYKNFITNNKEIAKNNSNLVWYSTCKLKGGSRTISMNMLNGELHLKFPTICTHSVLCDGTAAHCTGKAHEHTNKNNILSHLVDKNFYMKYNISISHCVRKKEYELLIMDQDSQEDWENNQYFEFDTEVIEYELSVYNHYSTLQEKGGLWNTPYKITYGDKYISNQYYLNNDGQCNIYIKNTELCSIKISLDIYERNFEYEYSRYRNIKHYASIDNGEIFPKDGYKRIFSINSKSYLPTHKEYKYSYKFKKTEEKKAIWEPYEWLGWHSVEARQKVSPQFSSSKKNTNSIPFGIRLEENKLN